MDTESPPSSPSHTLGLPDYTSTPNKSGHSVSATSHLSNISQDFPILLPYCSDSFQSSEAGSYFGESAIDVTHDNDNSSVDSDLDSFLEATLEFSDTTLPGHDSDIASGSQSSCESLASEATLPSAQPSPARPSEFSCTAGYKIVFDNIDKNVKPRYMRSDSQTRSLHYVQAYAVKDRINYAMFSGNTPTEINVYDILPSGDEYNTLKQNFVIHVSRVIVEYLPFFSKDFKGLTPRHIPHKYWNEMSKKSEIVILYTCFLL